MRGRARRLAGEAPGQLVVSHSALHGAPGEREPPVHGNSLPSLSVDGGAPTVRRTWLRRSASSPRASRSGKRLPRVCRSGASGAELPPPKGGAAGSSQTIRGGKSPNRPRADTQHGAERPRNRLGGWGRRRPARDAGGRGLRLSHCTKRARGQGQPLRPRGAADPASPLAAAASPPGLVPLRPGRGSDADTQPEVAARWEKPHSGDAADRSPPPSVGKGLQARQFRDFLREARRAVIKAGGSSPFQRIERPVPCNAPPPTTRPPPKGRLGGAGAPWEERGNAPGPARTRSGSREIVGQLPAPSAALRQPSPGPGGRAAF